MFHNEAVVIAVTEEGFRCSAAGLQGFQGGKFVADLVIEVHLTAAVDSQHQLPSIGMVEGVIDIVLALAQRSQVRHGIQLQWFQKGGTVQILLKFFHMDHQITPILRR